MKVLCCHGAITNGSVFKSLCGPLVTELNKLGYNDFIFPDGPKNFEAPEGFDEFFGEKPHRRWLSEALWSRLINFRGLEWLDSPEDTLRKLLGDPIGEDLDVSLAPLLEILDQDPEIDAIMGYSEGGHIASTLLLYLEERRRRTGQPSPLKFAIFLCGGPPTKADGRPGLADDMKERIETRTLHVLGARDPFVGCAIALWNMCAPDRRTMFDHAQGHNVPRNYPTVQELATKIDEIWGEVQEDERRNPDRLAQSTSVSRASSLESDTRSVEPSAPSTPPSHVPIDLAIPDPSDPARKLSGLNMEIPALEQIDEERA